METQHAVAHKILTGGWDDGIAWEFYVTTNMPPLALCTSVMCVPLRPTHEIIMTHNHRGWELPGGHIEPGETITQACARELHEEAGYIAEELYMFGYRKITSTAPIPHAQQKGFYPFPVSYIPYYVAMSSLPLDRPSGEVMEIFDAKAFTLDEVGLVREEFKVIAESGQRAFLEKRANSQYL